MHHFPKSLPNCIGWILPLVISFLLKGFLSFGDAVINSDGVIYLHAAQMIADGQFIQSLSLYPMPAYPFLIAVVHTVVPDWIIAAKLIGLSTAAAITVPIYFLTALLFDRKAAFYAAMAVAVLPSLNDIAPDVIRDPCFLFLACWSVYWMVKASMTERIGGVFMAFVIGGAALLFRIEAISLFVTYLLYLAGLSVFADKHRRFAIKSLLFLLIPSLVGMLSLVSVGSTAEGMNRVVQLQTMGQDLINGSFFARYQHIYTYLKDSERLSPLPSGDFYKLARHYMPLIYSLGMLEDFLKALFFPYAASLWVARRYCLALKKMYVVMLVLLVHGLMVFIYFLHYDYLSSRYLLLSAFLVLPLVGQGAVMLENKCRQLRWQKTSLAILLMTFLVLPLYLTVTSAIGEDRVIERTGHWLSGQAEVHQAEWAVNDLRYYIYAGKRFNYFEEKRISLENGQLILEKKFEELEKQVREAGKRIIIIKTSKKREGVNPAFRHFHKIKQIESQRSVVSIYADSLTLIPSPKQYEGIME